MKYGAEVFQYYLEYADTYGEVIKEAISKSRATNQVESSKKAILGAMCKQYEEIYTTNPELKPCKGKNFLNSNFDFLGNQINLRLTGGS